MLIQLKYKLSIIFIFIDLCLIIAQGSDPSVAFEVSSADKGLLPPRIGDTSVISNPVEGLLIYDLQSKCMRYYNGSIWSDCMGGITPYIAPIPCDPFTYEGQTYNTIAIGGRCWMAENLNIGIEEINESDNNEIEKQCLLYLSANCDIYGALYTWEEAMSYSSIESAQGICPSGWHIPSDDEWKALEIALGMSETQSNEFNFRGTDEGSKLSGNEMLWADGTLDMDPAFGSSGFSGLPAGLPVDVLKFNDYFKQAHFWSSSSTFNPDLETVAYRRHLHASSTQIGRNSALTYQRSSIRCIKN